MGINPFSKSPEKILAADIEKLRQRRVDVERQLPDAEAAIINRQAAARQLVIDRASDDLVAKAEAAIGDAERREHTIIGALEQLDGEIAAKQAELSAIVDRKDRSKTAATVEGIADDVADVMSRLAQLGQEVVEVFTRAELYTPDAAGMRVLGERITIEIPTTAELLVAGLKAYRDSVIAGSAPAHAREPAAPAPKPAAPALTTRVFSVKPLKWKDPGSPAFTLTRPAYAQVDLPPELAKSAIALHAAIAIDDPQVPNLRRHHPMKFAALPDCVAIDGHVDDEPDPTPVYRDEIARHSAFSGQ
jgi:hypothetical protein